MGQYSSVCEKKLESGGLESLWHNPPALPGQQKKTAQRHSQRESGILSEQLLNQSMPFSQQGQHKSERFKSEHFPTVCLFVKLSGRSFDIGVHNSMSQSLYGLSDLLGIKSDTPAWRQHYSTVLSDFISELYVGQRLRTRTLIVILTFT